MLRRLIEFSLSQRMLVLVLAALLAGAGGYALSRLPIDAYPDISTTQVKLILKAPGMTPEEVEQRVIAPLELELLGIPNQVILRSMAKYAIADITIDFTDSTDVYWARQQVSERLSEAMDALPDTVTGGLAPIATPLSEIFMFTIEGGQLSLAERRSLLDWVIRPALRTIPGVADVNALGGFVSSFEVVPDDAALLSAGLRIADIKSAIEQANRNDGAGRVSDGEEALIVRAVGAIRTLDDLREVMVKGGNGNSGAAGRCRRHPHRIAHPLRRGHQGWARRSRAGPGAGLARRRHRRRGRPCARQAGRDGIQPAAWCAGSHLL